MAIHRNVALASFLGGMVATACPGVAWAGDPTHAPDVASDRRSAEHERSSEEARAAESTASGASAPEATDSLVTLEVEAVGFDDDRGHAIATLFRPGANVLDQDEGCSHATSEIHNGAALLRFPPLDEGTYALVVFHDANDNGIVDHNFLHLPSEQLGFSNGFRPGIFSGLPSFKKLQFQLKRPSGTGPATLTIVMK